jgi:hypothetical protein
MASVRKRTIPTERSPLDREVSANILRIESATYQRDESLRPYSRFSRPDPLLLLPSSSSVALTRLSGPRSRPTTFFVVPGNKPGTSGSVARNSEHSTTEAVDSKCHTYIHMNLYFCLDRLLVRVPGYRSRAPGSIPGATRFF